MMLPRPLAVMWTTASVPLPAPQRAPPVLALPPLPPLLPQTLPPVIGQWTPVNCLSCVVLCMFCFCNLRWGGGGQPFKSLLFFILTFLPIFFTLFRVSCSEFSNTCLPVYIFCIDKLCGIVSIFYYFVRNPKISSV